MTQVVQCLTSKHEALSSKPLSPNKRKVHLLDNVSKGYLSRDHILFL
jgi:hypothetical protein